MITREFNLYLHAGHSIPLVINANQYDRGEQWLFTLFNADGTQYVPSSGAIVGIKSDNLGIINSGTVDASGRVVINETQQMTAAVGKAVFELVIDDGTHGTANFVVLVEPKPGDNADLSESDISMIEEAVEAAANIKPYGSPLVASTVAGMTDHEKVYVYVGSETGYTSGHWYYYDGDSWEDGGVYNSVAVQTDTTLAISGMAADAKKTGDEISDLKSQIQQMGGVPYAVKSSIYNLFSHLIYKDFDPTTDATVIRAWVSTVTAITLNQSAISISGEGTYQLVATTTPSGGAVSWQTSDPSVATVSASGLVTGVGNGTATITASSGDISASCTATITGFATLTSISAVYTQSGTVYTTDSLDSLKTDLVVTAHYDDSSTETLSDSDYTLSGTLEAGTSTITVSYGGKTTTFNVTVTAQGVPVGYTEVSYITANDNTTKTAKQYINTGIFPTLDGSTYKIETSLRFDSSQPSQSNCSLGSTQFQVFRRPTDVYIVNGTSTSLTADTSDLEDITFTQVASNGGAWTFTSSAGSANGTRATVSNAYPFTLFAVRNTSNEDGADAMKGSMSRFKLSKGDTVLLNMIACVRDSDGVAGMYDSVSDTFITSSGSENFSYTA